MQYSIVLVPENIVNALLTIFFNDFTSPEKTQAEKMLHIDLIFMVEIY